jgi:hypothetical protein
MECICYQKINICAYFVGLELICYFSYFDAACTLHDSTCAYLFRLDGHVLIHTELILSQLDCEILKMGDTFSAFACVGCSILQFERIRKNARVFN